MSSTDYAGAYEYLVLVYQIIVKKLIKDKDEVCGGFWGRKNRNY